MQQVAEFGGRISSFTGNPGMWDTYVNLGSGPRLLEYTLEMRSPTHSGMLFDDLNLSNYGYGGDPNNVSRLRISKGALYDFNANFHRDQNIFDYDLFVNPLNPSTSNPNIPILNSPHEVLLTRRMTDVNLALFPLAPVRVKLGWSRVVNDGSTFSTVHEGTEGLLFQPTLNTSDSFSFGVSFHVLPKTNISYDLFYTYFKGDTSAQLANPGQLAQFGVPGFNLVGGAPGQFGDSVSIQGQHNHAQLQCSRLVSPIRHATGSFPIVALAMFALHTLRSKSAFRAIISSERTSPAG